MDKHPAIVSPSKNVSIWTLHWGSINIFKKVHIDIKIFRSVHIDIDIFKNGHITRSQYRTKYHFGELSDNYQKIIREL